MELSEFLKPFVKESGFVRFGIDDNLAECTKNVPLGYGAYVIHRETKDGEIIYIGKAGTMGNDGRYKSVDLRHRLNANQQQEQRRTLFPKMMEEHKISALEIEWYIIDEKKVIPAFFEALLIQGFYNSNNRLPLWNQSF